MNLKTIVRHFVPELLIGTYHYLLARLSAVWFGHPSEKLIVVGVTGTNGKSTTVQFIGRLLESAGYRVGWTTTVSLKVADREWTNDQKMTMLGRFATQRLLREMEDAGCTHAVIETSSQGIVQSRHVGINYDIAVFTNLTPEHIEAHGGFERYKEAKGRLFASLAKSPRKMISGIEVEKTIVVNLADSHAEYFLSFQADRYCGFSALPLPEGRSTLSSRPRELEGVGVRLNTPPTLVSDIHYEPGCTTFAIGNDRFHLEPIGRFYLENALAAIAVVQRLGVQGEVLRRGVESLRAVPGRLEKIEEGQSFTVIVDYAYEPAALGALYETLTLFDGNPPLSPLEKGGDTRESPSFSRRGQGWSSSHRRIIHVLGSAGGGRDVARRAILGRMAAQHDDIVIVTNEDPYDEDPQRIIDDVADAARAAGKNEGTTLLRILDRQEAINQAIALAEPGDLVLITGKGSEPVMAVANGKKVPWDDRASARRAIRSHYGRA